MDNSMDRVGFVSLCVQCVNRIRRKLDRDELKVGEPSSEQRGVNRIPVVLPAYCPEGTAISYQASSVAATTVEAASESAASTKAANAGKAAGDECGRPE